MRVSSVFPSLSKAVNHLPFECPERTLCFQNMRSSGSKGNDVTFEEREFSAAEDFLKACMDYVGIHFIGLATHEKTAYPPGTKRLRREDTRATIP
jgi:hypothetical protein